MWEAYLLAVFGNAIPAFIIAAFAGKIHAWVVLFAPVVGEKIGPTISRSVQKNLPVLTRNTACGVGYIYRRSASHDGRVVGGGRGFYFGIPFKNPGRTSCLASLFPAFSLYFLTVGADKIFGPKLGMTLDRLINLQQKISETTKLLKLDELKEKMAALPRTDDRAGFLV